MGVARQSAMEKTCLMITFWGGLGEPFRSQMPYWVPEESQHQSGSEFEWLSLQGEVNCWAHSSRWAHRVRSRARSVPWAYRVYSRSRSVPWAHRVRSRSRSVLWAHRVRSRARSVSPQSPLQIPLRSVSPQSLLQIPLRSVSPQSPLQIPLRSVSPQSPLQSRSVPWAHRVRSSARSVPWANAVHSVPGAHTVRSVLEAHRACSVPGAHRAFSRMGILRNSLPSSGALCSTLVASCSACPALASCSAPPWHPWLPLSPGPLPLHGPGPPSLSRSAAPLVGRLGTSRSHSFKGGLCHLTTRGRHLPSSWTHFPKLHPPVTHHTLSCSPLSLSLYSLLTHHSAWLYCIHAWLLLMSSHLFHAL